MVLNKKYPNGLLFEGKDDTVLTEIITFLVGIIVDYSGGTEGKV